MAPLVVSVHSESYLLFLYYTCVQIDTMILRSINLTEKYNYPVKLPHNLSLYDFSINKLVLRTVFLIYVPIFLTVIFYDIFNIYCIYVI